MCLVSLRQSSLPDDKDDICIACYAYPASLKSHILRAAIIILHYADEEDSEIQRDSVSCLRRWTSKL